MFHLFKPIFDDTVSSFGAAVFRLMELISFDSKGDSEMKFTSPEFYHLPK